MRGYKPTYRGHILQIRKIAEAIENAKAPVICAGGGVINANASDKLIQLAERCRIPVTTTLMGIGVIPFHHELNLGMIGSHGSYMANYAVNNADLLLIIGARVGDRAMGSARRIAKKAQIVHIDIDPAEIGKNVEVSIPVVGDAGFILEELLKMVNKGDVEDWDNTIAGKKLERPLGSRDFTDKGSQHSKTVDPRYLINLISNIAGDNTIITTEVGQNQIWAANYFRTRRPRTFITSGGMGTMGYGLPAAIGAKIGSPESKVITISGDGSFQMSMQELGTIKQYNLGVKIITLNNSRLGMVRELQKNKYCGRYSQVYMENNPDFIKLADAYGFKGQRVSSNDQATEALEKMLSDDNAYILECIVDPEEPTL
jgi:acetolactate synthase-1/2/3 large subunit